MDPTYDQIELLITTTAQMAVALDECVIHLIYISKVLLAGFGITIGTLIWRNFILAKNQRHLL